MRNWCHLNKPGHILNWKLRFPSGQNDPELQYTSLIFPEQIHTIQKTIKSLVRKRNRCSFLSKIFLSLVGKQLCFLQELFYFCKITLKVFAMKITQVTNSKNAILKNRIHYIYDLQYL